jgi:hypothetical protein
MSPTAKSKAKVGASKRGRGRPPGPAEAATEQVAVRLPLPLIAALDAERARRGGEAFGVQPSRSEVIRDYLVQGLARQAVASKRSKP